MSAFDNGLTFQRAPELPEYPAYDVDIVSPELPCGSAWLVNCLIELGVPIWKPWNADVPGEWEAIGAHRYRYACAHEPWQRTLPALRYGRIFDFQSHPVPRVQHVWPGFYPHTAKTIFFARDPRDALYSVWQRNRAAGLIAAEINFVAFATSRYYHYPLSWAEYTLLFLRLWQAALSEREHLLLRYEDYRHDARDTLRRAVAFLGIKADEANLEHAARVSGFETLQRIENDLLTRGQISKPLNRAGLAYEYRTTFDTRMHAALGSRFRSVYAWLDYEADLSGVNAASTAVENDVDPLLEAMQADQLPTAGQAWLRKNLIAACADMALDSWPR
jgi:Sulfotransferase domain